MLGPLAVVAVGQQHHQAALAQPLGLAAADKLVKDDLRGLWHSAADGEGQMVWRSGTPINQTQQAS